MQRPRADRRRLDQAAHDAAPEKHCRDEHRVADLECGTRRLVDAGVHRPVAVRDVGSECFSALTGSGGQWRSRGRGGGVVQLLKRSTSGGELDSRAGRTHTPHTARGKTVGEWVSDASDRAATGASCDLLQRPWEQGKYRGVATAHLEGFSRATGGRGAGTTHDGRQQAGRQARRVCVVMLVESSLSLSLCVCVCACAAQVRVLGKTRPDQKTGADRREWSDEIMI